MSSPSSLSSLAGWPMLGVQYWIILLFWVPLGHKPTWKCSCQLEKRMSFCMVIWGICRSPHRFSGVAVQRHHAMAAQDKYVDELTSNVIVSNVNINNKLKVGIGCATIYAKSFRGY